MSLRLIPLFVVVTAKICVALVKSYVGLDEDDYVGPSREELVERAETVRYVNTAENPEFDR